MNDKMLKYCLKETETAVRIMARDKTSTHMFDYGKTPDGSEFVFLLAVLPKKLADTMFGPCRYSEPLEDRQREADIPQAAAGGKEKE